jgi:hypothetical protein
MCPHMPSIPVMSKHSLIFPYTLNIYVREVEMLSHFLKHSQSLYIKIFLFVMKHPTSELTPDILVSLKHPYCRYSFARSDSGLFSWAGGTTALP